MRRCSIPRRAALCFGSALLAPSPPAGAQGQGRVMRAVVGFPPGGTADILTRLLVERMRATGGAAAIIDNRPGAGGRIALDFLKSSPADGSVFAVTPASMLTIYPHLYPRTLRYDPLADFAPVTPICTFTFGFAVAAGHPARTLRDFIEWAKSRGGTADFASPVPGSMPHFIGSQLAQAAGLTLTHVPYRGSVAAMQDLLAGSIPAVLLPIGEPIPYHRNGEMRLLAVTSPQRLSSAPEVPTMAEAGFPGLTHEEWYGTFLPARVPAPVLSALHASIIAAASSPEFGAALARLEMAPLVLEPPAFAARLRRERDAWGPIVVADGFVPED